jgi:hypothetical protein
MSAGRKSRRSPSFKRVDLERVNILLSDLAAHSETDMREDDFKDIGSAAFRDGGRRRRVCDLVPGYRCLGYPC